MNTESTGNVEKKYPLTSSDAFFLNLGILLRSLLIYGVFLAFFYGWLPWYILLLCNIVFYPAVYLHVHDLGHGSSDKRIWFTSHFPLIADPIWGGLRAFRYTHQQHHRFFGTYRDPWLRYYNGHPLTSLFWNIFESEHNGYQYTKKYGLDRSFIISSTLNISMMAVNLFFFGLLYFWHLLSLRLTRAIAIYLFNYYTHRSHFSAQADFGVYERKRDLRYILPILQFFWGKILIDGLIYHNRHHSIKNWNIPVKYYQYLEDAHEYTKYHKQWPAKMIRDI